MPSKAFSFRLPDEAVQALETLNLHGETLNQTAQRVLMKNLGLSTTLPEPASISVNIPHEIINNENIQYLIKQEVQKAITQMRQEINQITSNPVSDTDAGQEIEERLHKLEDKWSEIEGFETDFNVWVDDLKDVSMLATQVKNLSLKVENFDQRLNTWVLRLSDLMEHWEGEVSETVDKLERKLGKYYGDVRDDVLKKLRSGEESTQGKAIDRFIKELEKNEGYD